MMATINAANDPQFIRLANGKGERVFVNLRFIKAVVIDEGSTVGRFCAVQIRGLDEPLILDRTMVDELVAAMESFSVNVVWALADKAECLKPDEPIARTAGG